MKNFKSLCFISLMTVLSACSSQGSGGDGNSLSVSFDGWRQIGDANWRIENGEFVADSGNGHLVTTADYADFQITLEFWVDEPANSGIFLRASNSDDIADSTSYEVNIFDTRGDQTYRTGGVVNFAAPSEVINTPGKWNYYDITAKGRSLVVVLNGVKTVDMSDDTYSEGPISLQYAAGVVKFRNVRIRSL